jgi:general secretion pathway protein D
MSTGVRHARVGPALWTVLFCLCSLVPLGGQETPADPGADRFFQFVDADVDAVFEELERLTGQSVLRPQALPNAQITFLPQRPLSREDRIIALESLLSLNGISLVQMSDRFLKAVPSSTVLTESPELIVGSTLDLRPTEAVFAKIFRLDFLSADEATAAVQPLLGGTGLITLQRANWLLIADSLTNLQRVERVLAEIDRKQERREEIRFFQIRNMPVREILANLDSLSEGPLGRYFSGTTALSAVEQSNQLVVVAHPDSMEVIAGLVREFDIDVEPLTTSKVFYIRHAVAEEVSTTLRELVQAQQQSEERVEVEGDASVPGEGPAGSESDGGAAEPVEATGSARLMEQAGELAAETAARMQFSRFASIVSDERANAVIAYGTESDIEQIGRLIERIDILLAQVRIEVVIVEVTLSENQVRGIDAFSADYNRASGSGGGAGGDQLVLGGKDGDALNIGGFVLSPLTLPDFSLESVFNTARSNNDVSVLSAPTVMTTHNREARVIVAESRPIVTGSTSSTDGGTTTSVDYRDIGIELTVKPLIADTGVIQMEIKQTVDNVVREITDTDNPELKGQPIIGTREAESFVSVSDSEIIVLGGLQERTDRRTENKIALLGDLPVLGNWLFTRRGEDIQTRELLIFIKPNVMLSPETANEDAEDQIGNLEQRDALQQYFDTGRFGGEGLPRIDAVNPDAAEPGEAPEKAAGGE